MPDQGKTVLTDYQFLDLTHSLHSAIPTWSGSCGFSAQVISDYPQGCRVEQLDIAAGIGTHMDAPVHFVAKAKAIADIALSQLIVPICLVNVSDRAQMDYLLGVDDLREYEEKHGIIAKNSLVIAYTGWSRHWEDPVKYRNANAQNVLHFPAFSAMAAQWLVERDVAGIGVDTLSPDSSDGTFPVHHIILGSGKYIIENIANAHLLPASGSYALVMPLKIINGTESPIRLVGLLPKSV